MSMPDFPDNPDDERYRFRLSLLAPSTWPTWLGLFVYFLITLLPLSIVDRLGERLGRFVASRNRKRFNIVCRNLSVCFPDRSEREIEKLAERHFAMQLRSLMHYFMIWWRPRAYVQRHLDTDGMEKLLRAQEEGRNIILLLAHSVGLEFAVSQITLDLPAVGIYKKLPNPVIEWLVVAGRRRFSHRFGSRIFNRDDGMRPILRELRTGKALIYLADEDLGESRSVFAPMFGIPKASIPLLGRLAKLGKAAVFPCVSCYDENEKKYTFHVLDAVDGLTGKDDVVDATLMNQAIERCVDLCPLQYLWTLRYFQTRPEGDASIYD